jgi:hypothetical protein
MTNQFGITGQQTHAVFLRLDQQQFVERVFMAQWLCQFGGGMDRRQWQQLSTDRPGEGHDGGRGDRALAAAGDVEAVPL